LGDGWPAHPLAWLVGCPSVTVRNQGTGAVAEDADGGVTGDATVRGPFVGGVTSSWAW
jgi:hypothetical protein